MGDQDPALEEMRRRIEIIKDEFRRARRSMIVTDIEAVLYSLLIVIYVVGVVRGTATLTPVVAGTVVILVDLVQFQFYEQPRRRRTYWTDLDEEPVDG